MIYLDVRVGKYLGTKGPGKEFNRGNWTKAGRQPAGRRTSSGREITGDEDLSPAQSLTLVCCIEGLTLCTDGQDWDKGRPEYLEILEKLCTPVGVQSFGSSI